MEFSQHGAAFLEQWEGFEAKPYQKPGDVPTIGIGTTFYPGGRHVTLNDQPITHNQAEQYAIWYMNTLVIPTLTQFVKVELSQNQVDALCDFTYNEGTNGFANSHLLTAINSNAGHDAIAEQFNAWVYVDHKVNDWQIKRRAAEVALYFN